MFPWYGSWAEGLEQSLGDPSSGGCISWRAAVERDEHDRFVTEPLAALSALGLDAVHVPERWGGALVGLEQLAYLGRALARREPALALATGMKSWSLLVWMAGSAAQQRRVATLLAAGQGLCFAASERRHGADLNRADTVALPDGEGWRLRGEKWPVGLSDRAGMYVVLAKTRPEATDPRSSSLFLVSRTDGAERIVSAGRMPTAGMRAAEVGGVEFRDLTLPPDALVGESGQGVELTLKLFQLTRPLVCSIALGIADTALRLAAQFALGRVLYGRPVADLAWVRARLGGAFSDLLVAEALLDATVRCAHVSPRQLQACSLVAKVVIPELTRSVLDTATEVLGARGYLREGFGEGVFQMLVRDHAVLEIFDGSTPVCLSALAATLPSPSHRPSPPGDAARRHTRLRLRFDPNTRLPEVPFDLLTLGAREDDVVDALDEETDPPAATARPLARWRAARASHLRKLEAVATAPLVRGQGRSYPQLKLAREYAVLHAAACCLHRTRHGRSTEAFVHDGSWLDVALGRLLGAAETDPEMLDGLERSWEALRSRLTPRPRTLSLCPLDLPDTPLSP